MNLSSYPEPSSNSFYMKQLSLTSILFSFVFISSLTSASSNEVRLSEIGSAWSKTSINATIFRRNSIVSNENYQFIAYYNETGHVVLAKRKLDTHLWETRQTQYKGNVNDAHNSISIMLDADDYLHMSWDHHNNALNYCRSLHPNSMEMGEKTSITGHEEEVVSYPEFYRFKSGDLLFAYRNGGSGNGNLILNRYDYRCRKWERIQSNLIDGEGARNAYWQIHIDDNDTIHVSWVWRENPNVASNHDLCYAKSADKGLTWTNSSNTPYLLPIRMNTAEIVQSIPKNSNLINQTSMTADPQGNAYIVTYYRNSSDNCTQFQLIYQKANSWHHSTITERTEDFELSGIGSRSIPISRPQILYADADGNPTLHVIYRDEQWANKACITSAPLSSLKWQTHTLQNLSLNRWEPSYDTELWRRKQQLHLYLQKVGQGQAETLEEMPPQPVFVLECKL